MAEVITKPVFWVIMVAIWALVFPMITGAYNSIYANTIDAAAITSERFERVMPKGTHTSAKDAWEARTAVADEASLTRVATRRRRLPDSREPPPIRCPRGPTGRARSASSLRKAPAAQTPT